jgi:DNA-binding transcriptional LysR family regulator
MESLDLDVLRTFVASEELGSSVKAAERVSKTPSAVSLQLKRLEQQVGKPLRRRVGRGFELTEAGSMFMAYARRLIELNDEALEAVRGESAKGEVRLGVPQDLAERWLPPLLGVYARSNPQVRLDVKVERNRLLLDGLEKGSLDLAVTWDEADSKHPRSTGSVSVPLCWIRSRSHEPQNLSPLPLVLFDGNCIFRKRALRTLDESGIPWRITFTSPSLSGLWAAVDAGLGITLRTPLGLPPGLETGRVRGVRPLGRIRLRLARSENLRSPAALRLEALLRDGLSDSLTLRM